ncbi:NAD(P)-binding domain-containing protein [Nocardia sp. CDC159]|uniref:NAD(P)-binding domain-containing protein n=1 Tax=Nocardia pulmonis TaxID=2951408 RepID=A0A9X2J062_9NOCA|nr:MULTISPECIES: NAD(P)-binding domain-containing protein [Nocardia]MCM6775661.1 NAD(P)-binding domain-containing protein [Nocardia pulmonis]MCM6788363.1 NAD(P)-binding domain-containing protein [Nocardia sp. CDC159]
MDTRELPRVCVIGAGPSGITTAKRLAEYDIPFDCYEASDEVGGNWYFKNPNGMSACYQSLHIDTSKYRLQFEDFPAPDGWPDFPHHAQLFQYFRDYVDHFGLRERIRFNTKVVVAERDPDGLWLVRTDTGETAVYDVLIVATGHHWDPNLPDYPGEFHGELLHSHAYNDPFDPVDMRGKRIVVVGMGNSGLDIASELSQKFLAERLFVSARRGVWVLPKYVNGRVGDRRSMPRWMPPRLGLRLKQRFVRKYRGEMENYGLPKPDHLPFEAHPSASEEFLHRAGCGDIVCKPAITRLDGDRVHFADGSAETVDVVLCATGYRISFPFFSDPNLLPGKDNRFPLFQLMMKPGVNDLFFMGLAQPLPTLVNFAEQQSKFVVAYLTGRYHLPTRGEIDRAVRDQEARRTGRYYDSPRHTIQVEFQPYVRGLFKELARGAKRAAAAGNSLPVAARAAQGVRR